MTVSRQAANTLSQLRARVLREAGDPDGDRWAPDASYTDVDEAINNQLVELGNHMATDFPGEALVRTTMTYTDATQPAELPAAVGAEAIYKVEDVSTTNLPVAIEYISPLELEDYDPGEVFGSYYRYRYSLFGPTGDDKHLTYRIQLYPKTSANLTLRISYIDTPYVFGATTSDTSPLSPRWVELVSLGAALKLLRRDEEATQLQLISYGKLWNNFVEFSRRQRGPKRVRRRRRGM